MRAFTSKKNKTVFVAMSGGVDSSVSAALLVKGGFRVVGVFMKNWENTVFSSCPWEEDQRDVQRVCRVLGIPMTTWHFEREYARLVLRYFFREYARGKTPNPDVVCNREIKFGLFLNRALAEGADAIATGHYAQVEKRAGTFSLLRGNDPNKDQSYFLWQLTQRQLARTLFPVGHLTKPEVRKLARRFRLPVADKKDSQGICFIGEVNLNDFLKQRIKEKPGKVFTTKGKEVGTHRGIAFYTVGQRHGFQLTKDVKGPFYVIRKDRRQNTLIIGQGNDPALFCTQVQLQSVRWIAGKVPRLPLRCTVQIRYRQPAQAAVVRKSAKGVRIDFKKAQRAVTPGQSAVFYRGADVIGGGVIE